MVDTVIESGSWPVNELGEILASPGVGTSTVVGYIPSEMIPTDPSTNRVRFKLTDGAMTNTVWQSIPSIFRLLMNGTGTVQIDSRNRAGTVSTGVYTTTLTSAVNQIAFPYAGDGALQIRAILTGSATVEVV